MQTLSLTVSPNRQVPIDPDVALIHLRLSGTEDLQIPAFQTYLQAAKSWAEGQTRRTLLDSVHIWTVDRFPTGGAEIRLPQGICTELTSIVYTDGSGQVTLTPADVQVDLSSVSGARVRPLKGQSWPSVDSEQINPVQFTFRAGWLTPEEVPADIQNALLIYAADRLEAPTSLDITRTIDMAETLLSPWKIVNFNA